MGSTRKHLLSNLRLSNVIPHSGEEFKLFEDIAINFKLKDLPHVLESKGFRYGALIGIG